VIDVVKASGLARSRGCGLPTGLKWTFLPKDIKGPVYLCINGDESEPGTFNNRVLIEEDHASVLEGIVISSFATKTTTAYFFSAIRIRSMLSRFKECDRRDVCQQSIGQKHFGVGL
jgi:NADH-quinone oxidoreductase subunit F